jgi:hypothetical protein
MSVSVPVLASAAADQIQHSLSFDREQILQAGHRIVASGERAADSLQALEAERILFTSVDHDDRLTLTELGPDSSKPVI